jgi:hypothetical protein
MQLTVRGNDLEQVLNIQAQLLRSGCRRAVSSYDGEHFA